MIVDALVAFVKLVLGPIFAVLPVVDFSPIQSQVTAGAGAAGEMVGIFNAMFPVTEMLDLAVWWFTYVMPAICVYLVANWVYRHIPTIAGFGPGAG
jgi:hypothetical protein